jgi:ribosomal 50S subunit-recycling heat shock protein
MRLDQFLSRVGIVKKRTVAKEMAENGLIKLNGRPAKPAATVAAGDIIMIGGSRPAVVEIKKVPSGSVRKEERENYFHKLN